VNVALQLDAAVRRAPDRIALIEGDERLTHRQLERRAGGFALALRARGLGAGSRVALALPNGIAFAVALYGALKVGATVSPLNPQLTADERARTLDDFGADIVIDTSSDAEADAVTIERPDAPAIVLYTSGSTGRPKGAVLPTRPWPRATRRGWGRSWA
jgi:acyl-CoA synthetase (AMP-forming)/AMP-acid ligase II